MAGFAQDPFQAGASLVHRLDASVKVGLSAGFILATALTPAGAWPVFIILAALAVMTTILAELRPQVIVVRLAAALPFALAAVPLVFTVPGTPWFRLPWGWTATVEGLARAASVIVKSGLSVLMAVVLTTTTPFTEILAVLRRWGLPKLLVAILALTWRYLFVLADEASRLLRARAARSGHPADARLRSLVWQAQVTGSMAGNLLLRGTDRAERIHGAMLARGYDGEPRVLAEQSTTAAQRTVLAAGIAFLIVLTALGLLLWG